MRGRRQRHPHERCGDERGDCRQIKVRLPRALREVIAHPAADEGADESRDDDNGAEADGGLAARNSADALQKRRHPVGKTAHRKGVSGVSQDRERVGFVAQQTPVGQPGFAADAGTCGRRRRRCGRRGCLAILGPSRRVAQKQAQRRQHETRNAGDKKRRAPTVAACRPIRRPRSPMQSPRGSHKRISPSRGRAGESGNNPRADSARW